MGEVPGGVVVIPVVNGPDLAAAVKWVAQAKLLTANTRRGVPVPVQVTVDRRGLSLLAWVNGVYHVQCTVGFYWSGSARSALVALPDLQLAVNALPAGMSAAARKAAKVGVEVDAKTGVTLHQGPDNFAVRKWTTEFPDGDGPWLDLPDLGFTCGSDEFLNVVKHALSAAPANNYGIPRLEQVWLEHDSNTMRVTAAGTDRFRLAASSTFAMAVSGISGVGVPANVARSLTRLIPKDTAVSFRHAVRQTKPTDVHGASPSTSDVWLTTAGDNITRSVWWSRPNMDFVEWRKVAHVDGTVAGAKVDRRSLLAALTRLRAGATGCRIQYGGAGEVWSMTSDPNSYPKPSNGLAGLDVTCMVRVEPTHTGESAAFRVGLDAKFLQDAVRVLGGDQVVLEFGPPARPVMLHGTDPASDRFVLLMPRRLPS